MLLKNKEQTLIRPISNKIGHSSRSSSIQRSKATADQRCLIITIFENGQKTNRQTDKKKKRPKEKKTKEKRKKKKRPKKNRLNKKSEK